MPIVQDTIQARHEIIFGQPQPQENYCQQNQVLWAAQGKDIFDLADFPYESLPSGGASCRISESEMVMLYVKLYDYTPRNDAGLAELYRLDDTGTKLILGKITTSDFGEDPEWTTYWSWDWVIFGHFGWEINQPGKYGIMILYPQGTVEYQFTVIDSTKIEKYDCATTVYDIISSNRDIWDGIRKLNNGTNPSKSDAQWFCDAGITTEAALRTYIQPWAGNTETPPVSQPETNLAPKCPRGSTYTAEPFLGIFAICDSGYRKIEGTDECECQYEPTTGKLVKPGAVACAENDWECQIGKLMKYIIPGIILLFAVQILGALKR